MNRNIFRSRVNAVRARRGKTRDCGMLPTGKRVRLIKWYLVERGFRDPSMGTYKRSHGRFGSQRTLVTICDRPRPGYPINWPKSVAAYAQ